MQSLYPPARVRYELIAVNFAMSRCRKSATARQFPHRLTGFRRSTRVREHAPMARIRGGLQSS